MERDVWIRKQEELFELYFKNYGESINLEQLVISLVEIKEIWQNLYQILETELEYFDNHSRVLDIKEIEYMDRQYLILKFFPFEYLVVDCVDEKVLLDNEIFKLFSQEFFIDNFGETFIKDYKKVYDFAFGSDTFAKCVLDFYRDNRDILVCDNNFCYEIKHEDNCVTSICVDVSNLKVTLGFNYFGEVGRCNYIFLDDNLVAYGVSNPDGNIDSLKKMGDRVRNINVPRDKIPEYILGTVDKFLQKENQDKNLGLVKGLSCR